MAVLQGTDLFVSVGDDQVGFAQTCSIVLNTEIIDQNTKSNASKFASRRAGRKTGTISTNGLYDPSDTAQAALITAAFADSAQVTASYGVANGTTESATNSRYVGTFIITSLELNSTDNEDATFTATLESAGAITRDNTGA